MDHAPETLETPKAGDTLEVLEPDDLEGPESSTLSPVAARKEHFENIFRKPAPSLTSPSEFKHYEPGSLVKKRHSWLQDEIIDNKKPLAPSLKYQFKSPLLRRLVQKRSKTPPCETDEKNSEEDADDQEGRDEQDENQVQASTDTRAPNDSSPTSVMGAAGNSSSSQSSSRHGAETQEAMGVDKRKDSNTLEVAIAVQPHEPESAFTQQEPTAPMDEIEITVSSISFGEVRDHDLNVSALETDERGEDVAMVAAKRQQNETTLRRTMQQEKLKAAQRRHRKLKRGDSDEPKIAAENPVPVVSADATDAKDVAHMQTIAAMPSASNDYDEWQMVRVNSQSCDARCLDAVSCAIL